MNIESSILIQRPAEAVWSYVSDFDQAPVWNPATLEVRMISPGPLRKGSACVWVGHFFGRRMEAKTEVTGFEPGQSLPTGWCPARRRRWLR